MAKAETYIGFAIKAGKLIRGSGAVENIKKTVYLLIADYNASENTKKLIMKFKNRFSCPLIYFKENFEKSVNRAGCKVAAVLDENLARAICENPGDNVIYK